ncbi:hypothetical protein [Streptomyces termitum]|uniref:hypothetical protein n=1 Tax=Streptomyces termitum TaxID=67368 RepID=UPI00379B4512
MLDVLVTELASKVRRCDPEEEVDRFHTLWEKAAEDSETTKERFLCKREEGSFAAIKGNNIQASMEKWAAAVSSILEVYGDVSIGKLSGADKKQALPAEKTDLQSPVAEPFIDSSRLSMGFESTSYLNDSPWFETQGNFQDFTYTAPNW